jgi:hypothetical protein
MKRTEMKRTQMRRRKADNHLGKEEWDHVFLFLQTRSGNRCECCGESAEQVTRDRIEVQHRRAQGMGGTSLEEANSLANLLLLHGACHRWVESRPSDPRGPQYPDLAEQRGLWVRHEYDGGELVPVETYPLVLWSWRRVLLHPTAPIYLPHPDPYGTAYCLVPD